MDCDELLKKNVDKTRKYCITFSGNKGEWEGFIYIPKSDLYNSDVEYSKYCGGSHSSIATIMNKTQCRIIVSNNNMGKWNQFVEKTRGLEIQISAYIYNGIPNSSMLSHPFLMIDDWEFLGFNNRNINW
jgi:hypothetical protein